MYSKNMYVHVYDNFQYVVYLYDNFTNVHYVKGMYCSTLYDNK